MPRLSAVRALQEFDEPAMLRDIDYDAAYRALDLPPGASPREIQDRAQLIGTAFQPDGLPGALMVLAQDRAGTVDRAAGALSRYWKTHGKAPPAGEPARLSPLSSGQDVLGREAAAPQQAHRAPQSEMPDAGAIDRPRNRIHLAAHSARIIRAAPSAPTMSTKPATAGRAAPASDSGAIAPRSVAPVLSSRWSVRSLLLKAVMVGLVIAAAVRVQQYRAEHPPLAAPGEANSAIATAMPSDRPAQWPGMTPSRQMFGAAAPAVSGHQRQN
jgi:hypothetical protein